ncbi:MAG: peptidoglycan endopeptidase [Mycobacterium sp.]
MYALAALMALIGQVSGTPYISGGDTPAGTDCSGLASWVANVASGRPAFGSRFNTGNIEGALLSRGFHYGSAANSVVIGWNGGHAAVTLPDGTPVSSGESGSGVRVGGGGAYQPQFSHHMYLPVEAETMHTDATPQSAPDADATSAPSDVTVIDIANTDAAPSDIATADIAAGTPAPEHAVAAPVADGDTSIAT